MVDEKTMIFKNIGGRHQLSIDSPEDLYSLLDLDEAHWMATSAPIETFNCEKAFLDFLDADSNKRIRCDEVKNAVKWLLTALKDISILNDSSDTLPLSAINTENDIGKELLSSAKLMLANLNATESDTISLAQTRSRQEILSSGKCNGDGVIPASSIQDAKLAEFVTDVISVSAGVADASGGMGVTSEIVDKFMSDLKAYLDWNEKSELKEGEEASDVLIWGTDTSSAYDALFALQEKIDQYFAQCALVKQDGAFEKRFRADDANIAELDVSSVASMRKHIETAPLASPTHEERIVFDDKINPFYRDAAANFAEKVLKIWKKGVRVKNALTLDEWKALKSEFASFAAWRAAKPVSKMESLPLDKLRVYAESGNAEALSPLFEKDMTVAKEIQRGEDVEKLILFKKHMMEFANNFVSFASLYNPESLSILQVGRLIMDARHFELNLNVVDVKAHKKTAVDSNICVMYLKLTSKNGGVERTMNIVTGVTSGTINNLRIGKRGVFTTPDGEEWDAEVVDFIQHPVSILEALKSPFVKLAALIKKHTEKLKASTYKKFEGGVDNSLSGAEKTIVSGPATKSSTSWTGPMMLLGGGIGIAGIGSAFASVMNALKGEGVLLKIGLFILGIVVVVATPIIVAAILKLRHRNIGMMLEACGWSINASMRLNRKLGLLFTRVPAYPRNSRRTAFDYTRFYLRKLDIQKSSPWTRALIAIATLAVALLIGALLRNALCVDRKVENILSGAPKIHVSTPRKSDTKPTKTKASKK